MPKVFYSISFAELLVFTSAQSSFGQNPSLLLALVANAVTQFLWRFL
jgi:hypothetical protein